MARVAASAEIERLTQEFRLSSTGDGRLSWDAGVYYYHLDSLMAGQIELEEDALKALVRRKASGKPIKVSAREEKPDNVVNLMDALKASLKGKSTTKRRASAPRRTSARRAAKKAHRSAARQRKAG